MQAGRALKADIEPPFDDVGESMKGHLSEAVIMVILSELGEQPNA